jgi:hypothetical protein
MAWIESHTVLIRHRKLRDLARELRIRPSYAMGHLHALWHAAMEQREDGDMSEWSDEFIAETSDYPGDAPQFVRLLQKHGWLDGKLIHDWVDYAGLFLTRKYSSTESGRTKLKAIWCKHGRVYGDANGTRTVREQSASLPNQPTVPNLPTKPTNKAAKCDVFEKPTLEMMQAHANEIGLPPGEAVSCHAYYESNGWRVGRNPMKNWKFAMVNWRKNWQERNAKPQRNSQPCVNRNEGTYNNDPAKWSQYDKLLK